MIHGLRNLRGIEFEPDSHLTFLIGDNGQGKTSVLEALGLLASLKSFRGAQAAELLGWGEPRATATAEIESSGLLARLELIWERAPLALAQADAPITRQAKINGKPYASATRYLSQRFGSLELGFHAVVFNPSDHELVRGEPALRRSFLDRAIAAERVDHLERLTRYQRLLTQRNALLKRAVAGSGQGGAEFEAELASFTEPWTEFAAAITHARLEWLVRANRRLPERLASIAPRQRELRLLYASQWIGEVGGGVGSGMIFSPKQGLPRALPTERETIPDVVTLATALRASLSRLARAEREAGVTLCGPHRDDWAFVSVGSAEAIERLQGHGSQGEVRSALLALKFVEIELFREHTGHRPVFLLDDLSSELDRERRAHLFEFLRSTDLQALVSATEAPLEGLEGRRLRLSGGRLEALSD